MDPAKGYGFVRPKDRQKFPKDVFFHFKMVVNVDGESDVQLCNGLKVKIDLDGLRKGNWLPATFLMGAGSFRLPALRDRLEMNKPLGEGSKAEAEFLAIGK